MPLPSPPPSSGMIRLSDLRFDYPRSDFQLAIDDLSIEPGTRVAVVGPSGCGKTTLLNLLAGILLPRRGAVEVAGRTVSALSDAARRNFRAASIGMVFQQFELIEYLSLEENILLPRMINRSLGLDRAARARGRELAASMGLGDKLRRNVRRLSQGEQQRVAICRALLTQPPLILADEPTGNLDPRNKTATIELLFDYCRQHAATLVVVTHDQSILGGFDRQIDFAAYRREEAA